jgi:hypothetical protein
LLFEMLEDRLTPATPTLTATPYPTAVSFGGTPTTLTDTAVLANGNNPTGTIIFDLLGPSGNYVDTGIGFGKQQRHLHNTDRLHVAQHRRGG